MTRGHYGKFGGQFVAETLMEPLRELETAYNAARRDLAFRKELRHYLENYGGRPTALYHCRRLSTKLGGAQIYLKREDLVHGGAHKFNNVMGQALLAKRMGKKRIIAETGAGQHGVATAIAGAVLGIPVEVYMGEVDTQRQRLNVFRMHLLGAKVHTVTSGTRTLKDAINEALRDWVATVRTTYYCLGSVVGPHPYPRIVRDFQSVIGKEIRRQTARFGFEPDVLIACVGGGSNAAGTFAPFIRSKARLIGVEAGGDRRGHSATLGKGKPGILHGALTYLLQTPDGQVEETHSISAGLDYPGVGPEHSFWKDSGRVEYVAASDRQALAAFETLAGAEGILPALESAHAVAHAIKLAPRLPRSKRIVVTLSGRGDKDVHTVAEALGVTL
ncbi:MAG TPA: tryptophan synthase subunit beta [Candidatus Thermoplasmatota archaeon]|nr:tryptophan synthase subunit beta [Candidatus Thermoplasmatota archaeon]